VADEVTPVLTQADIDKAVADAIAKQKAADDADANVSVGHYKVDKKWLKWAVSAILLLAYANGFLDKETVTTLITTFPMSKAPEKPAEPPTLAAPTAVSPDDVAKWIDIFKPLIQPDHRRHSKAADSGRSETTAKTRSEARPSCHCSAANRRRH